jgi:hypothetical protein
VPFVPDAARVPPEFPLPPEFFVPEFFAPDVLALLFPEVLRFPLLLDAAIK